MTDQREKLLPCPIRAVVDQQAEDDGLWFIARTAAEGYLQQELRRLHSVIEYTRTQSTPPMPEDVAEAVEFWSSRSELFDAVTQDGKNMKDMLETIIKSAQRPEEELVKIVAYAMDSSKHGVVSMVARDIIRALKKEGCL